MGTAILIVVVVLVVAVVGFGVALARKGKCQFAEQGTGPGLAQNAPREWSGAHTQEAKLQRRLAAAAKSLAAQPMGDTIAIEQRVTIEQQIQQLDQQLVAVATAPGLGRTEAVAELE